MIYLLAQGLFTKWTMNGNEMEMSEIYNGSLWAYDIFSVNKP